MTFENTGEQKYVDKNEGEIRETHEGRELYQDAFEKSAEAVGRGILAELRRRYEGYEYHNEHHSHALGDQAAKFLEMLDIPDAEKKHLQNMARFAGYAHDYDQDFVDPWPSRGEGKVGYQRVRHSGVIEATSSDVVEQELQESLEAAGYVFLAEDRARIREAIMVTVPGWSVELSTVTQPNLSLESHPLTFAIAAADIAMAGYDAERFVEEGDNIFSEDNMLPVPESLSDEEAEQLLAEVIGWSQSQIQFTKGQKELWSRDFIPEFLKNQLREFDKAIILCQEKLASRIALVVGQQSPQQKLRVALDDMQFTRYIT